jgi:hypothetical protein
MWMAACSTGTDGSAPTPEAGMDAQEGGATDTSLDQMSADGSGTGGQDAADGSPIPADGSDGGEGGGDGSADGSTPSDGGVDGNDGNVGCNANNCGGACCGDKCLHAQSCEGCTEGPFYCPYSLTIAFSNGKCVTSCAECDSTQTDASAVACFACGAGLTPVICAGSAMDCPTTAPEGACTCGDGGVCPGSTQVCAEAVDASVGVCLSCGQTGTDGLPCTSGKVCNQALSICQ